MSRAQLYDEVNWAPQELLTADFPTAISIDTRHRVPRPVEGVTMSTGVTRLADGTVTAVVSPTVDARGARCSFSVGLTSGLHLSKLAATVSHVALPGLRAAVDAQATGARLVLDYRAPAVRQLVGVSTALSLPRNPKVSACHGVTFGEAQAAVTVARGRTTAGAKGAVGPSGTVTRAEGFVTYDAGAYRLSSYVRAMGQVLGCTYFTRPTPFLTVAVDARLDATSPDASKKKKQAAVVEAAARWEVSRAVAVKARLDTDSKVGLSVAARVVRGVRAVVGVCVNAGNLRPDGGHKYGLRISLFDE